MTFARICLTRFCNKQLRWSVCAATSAAALSAPLLGLAQDAATVQQATTFAKTLAPMSAAQVVNPAGVNGTVWGSSTATPASVPTNLGRFSAPTTSGATYAGAKASGLTALGTQALVDCANYVAGPSSDPAQTQACAAVNFLTNQCLTPTTTQGAVLGHVGVGQVVASNCAGTYGDSVHTFNLQNQVTASDPVFTVVKNLGTTAAATVGSVCTTQSVVTAPAQNTTNLCTKSSDATAESCSQFMNATIVTSRTAAKQTETCPTGTLIGDYCQATSTGAAQSNYVCPPGQTLQGTQCVGPGVTTPAILAAYTCPPGQTLSGSICVGSTNTDDGAASTALSCAPGATLTGSSCLSSSVANATYPVGLFCLNPYGGLLHELQGESCVVTGRNGTPIKMTPTQAPGCPGQNDFTWYVEGENVAFQGSYSNGHCVFDVATGSRSGPLPCPIPDPTKYVLENAIASKPGFTTTSGVCSYVPLTTYSCPPGETLDVDNKCQGGSTTTAIVSNYFCPTGGAYSNGQCTTTNVASATVTYSCPTTDTVVGTRCTKTTTTSTPASPGYTCPAGYTLDGSNCSRPGDTIAATVNYTCQPGAVLQGTMCVTTTTEPATIEYSCVDGSAPIAGICVIKSAQTSWTDTCTRYETSAGSMLPHP